MVYALPYTPASESRWKTESKGFFSDLGQALCAPSREGYGKGLPYRRMRTYNTPAGGAVRLFHGPYRHEPAYLCVIKVTRQDSVDYGEHERNCKTIEVIFRHYSPVLGTAGKRPERCEIAVDLPDIHTWERYRDACVPTWISVYSVRHWDQEAMAVTEGHGQAPLVYHGNHRGLGRSMTVYSQGDKHRFELKTPEPYLSKRDIYTWDTLEGDAKTLWDKSFRFLTVKPKMLRKYGYNPDLANLPTIDALQKIKPEHRRRITESLPPIRLEGLKGDCPNIGDQTVSFGPNNKQKQKDSLSETKTDHQQKQAFRRWIKGKYGNESTTKKEVTGKSALGTPGEKTTTTKPSKCKETRP